MGISQYDPAALGRPAWNAGKQVGVKKPLKQRQIWAVRFFLDREGRMRDHTYDGRPLNLGDLGDVRDVQDDVSKFSHFLGKTGCDPDGHYLGAVSASRKLSLMRFV